MSTLWWRIMNEIDEIAFVLRYSDSLSNVLYYVNLIYIVLETVEILVIIVYKNIK